MYFLNIHKKLLNKCKINVELMIKYVYITRKYLTTKISNRQTKITKENVNRSQQQITIKCLKKIIVQEKIF